MMGWHQWDWWNSAKQMLCVQDITEKKHRKLLADNRHLRYMWIPYTDSVVVVTNNMIADV